MILPFEIQELSTFSGSSSFLQSYVKAFPDNRFNLGWVECFTHFYKNYGLSWVCPIKWFDGKVVAYYVREIFGKSKLVIHGDVRFWYGMELFSSGWKQFDPVILVEGPKDRFAVSQFYPYCQAILGTGFGGVRLEVFSSIVKKCVLLLDGDEAGRNGASLLQKDLGERGVSVRIIYLSDNKDPGDFLESSVQSHFLENKLKEALNAF